MKQWFEYQSKHQRDPAYELGRASQPIANVAEHMDQIFDHVKKIHGSPQVTSHTEKIFSRDADYLNTLAPNVPEIDPGVLEQWVYDERFDNLLDRPSHEVTYFHERQDYQKLIDQFVIAMDLNHFVGKANLGAVKLHIQYPGQIFPLHFDRPQHRDFDISASSLRQSPSHQRYLVFLDDMQPGQLFQMDLDLLHWRRGDVFTWDARNTMHGSANVGFWPRWMLMYTFHFDAG